MSIYIYIYIHTYTYTYNTIMIIMMMFNVGNFASQDFDFVLRSFCRSVAEIRGSCNLPMSNGPKVLRRRQIRAKTAQTNIKS